jgi:transglutaminase/protease-like cytokinesis protein 3
MNKNIKEYTSIISVVLLILTLFINIFPVIALDNSYFPKKESLSVTDNYPTVNPLLSENDFIKYNKKICLSEKTEIQKNYNGINETSQIIIKQITNKILNLNTTTNSFSIKTPVLNRNDKNSIHTYFRMYYGRAEGITQLLQITDTNTMSIITINMDLAKKYEIERKAIYKKIDLILSDMQDGEDEYILFQISEYLRNNIVYTDDYYDVYSALFEGKGVCNSYAFLFKMMAERVGIKTDVCLGYTSAGTYHAWNRVEISNNTYRYYDITLYDESNNINYINSQNKLHRIKTINVYL